MKEQTSKLNSILDSQENLIVVSDGYKIVTANRSFLESIGINSIEMNYLSLLDLFKKFDMSSDDFFYFYDLSDEQRCINELQQHINDIFVKIYDTKEIAHIFKLQLTNYNFNGSQYVLSFTDITKIKQKSDDFQYKANHDELTGLLNRHYFNDMLFHELKRAFRYKHIFTLVMFDIDHFKQINDTYGHDIGDVVLQNLSNTVLENIRSTDILARWGGEEFMLFLPETTVNDAQHKIELLRKTIKSTKLTSQIERPITVSFGLTQLEFSDSKHSLLKRVDVALYNAKTSGRDKLEIL